MRKLAVLSTLIVCVLLLASALSCQPTTERPKPTPTPAPTPAPNRVVSESLIDQIDFSSWMEESFRISPDSKRLAYRAKVGNKSFVVVDGKEGKQYDDIKCLIFSPDSKRLAYRAKVGNKALVVVDGMEGQQYDGIVTIGGGRIIFESPDSLHYLAGRGNSFYLVEERIE